MGIGTSKVAISQSFRIIIVTISIIICISLIIASAYIIEFEIINPLLFFPVVLTGIWFKRKTILVALALSITQFIYNYWMFQHISTPTLSNILSLIFIAFLFSIIGWSKNNKQEDLNKENNKYKIIFNNAAEAFFVIQDNRIKFYNDNFIALCGYTKKELNKMNPFDTLIYENDRKKMMKEHICRINSDSCENIFRIIKKDGSIVWVRANAIKIELGGKPAIISSLMDITSKKKIEDQIKDNEKNYALLLSQMNSGLLYCKFINNGKTAEDDCIIIKANKKFKEILELDENFEIEGKPLKETIPELNGLFDKFKNIAKRKLKVQSEFYLKKLNKFIEYYAFSPNKNEFSIFVHNITKRKKMEKEVQYLDTHDALTGLYNERYLESVLQSYNSLNNGQTSIIVAQLNGVKLANNAFRHLSWEDFLLKFTNILKEECREIDIVTREGRDKFVVILPLADKNITEKIVQNIRTRINKEAEKEAAFSAAIGYDTKNEIADDINDVYEQAKSNMYKDKLLMKDNIVEKNIQTIVNALYRISDIEQEHANNVSLISEKIALAMNIPEYEIKQIKTAALLHDVGNISIDPAILTKKGKYTDEEWEILKKHPEAGYRILSTSGLYKNIAKYVFEHHEKWDGTGYPKGLKGEEILLPARIIALADAFDAMMTDKPYKKAYTFEEAISELKKNAGKQFDPNVIEVFINKVAQEFNNNKN